jgi:hypothetical protein
MKFSLIVLGLLVVGYAHWPWTGRLAAPAREDSPLAGRYRMVEDQIKARGIKDERVLADTNDCGVVSPSAMAASIMRLTKERR